MITPDVPPPPFPAYELPGVGTVIDHADGSYVVRLPDGRVTGFPAQTGAPSVAAAAADYAWAQTQSRPEPVVVLSPLTILSRLNQQEEAALVASTDLAVAIVRNRLIAASEVRSDDPRTGEGKAILIAKGIITAERAEQIFA